MTRERLARSEKPPARSSPAPSRGDATAAARQPPAYGIALADNPGPIQRRARTPEHSDPLERQADRIAGAVAGEGSLSGLIKAVGRRTGAALGEVRFHHDEGAALQAGQLDALAFTTGRNVYFGHGQFDPHSRAGRELIAHELVHVAQQQTSPERVQRFEAPKHQAAEQTGLTGVPGFTQEEAFNTYFGNWMRDLNQLFVPMIMEFAGGSADFPAALVGYMGAKKFGREFQLEDFGYYIPAEHIDSPAGLVKQYDLLPEQPKLSNPALRPPVPAHPRPPHLETYQEEVAPGTKVLGADIFSVDQTGMIAFLSRTLVHIEKRLRLAVGEGRNPAGFMHLGAALHAVEDLFAHSNWIEIAVGKLLADDPALLPELKGAERRIFNFAPDVTVPGKSGQGEQRAVLMTGSFTGLDTKMSIGSELVNMLRAPYEPPASELEARAQERLTYVGLKTFHTRVSESPELQRLLTQLLVKHAGMPEPVAKWTVKRDISKAYWLIMQIAGLLPWEVRVYLAQVTHSIMESNVYHPLADKLEADALEANVADTSLLKNREEAERLSQGKFTAAEEETMKGVATAGDELGRKKSVAEQKKKVIDEQTTRLGDLKKTPEYVVAGPSHSMIAKDHSNSPFFGLAFKVARLAVSKIGEKLIGAWVEVHGEGARKTSPAEVEADPTVALVRKKGWTEAKEFGEKVLEHGGDPKQSYDLAGQREAAATSVENAGSLLYALAKTPEQVDAALKALGVELGKLNPTWVKRIAHSLSGAGTVIKREGTTAAQVADLETLAADLKADGKMIREARTGEAREAAYDRLIADRDRTFQALVARPQVDLGTRVAVLAALDEQIHHIAVAYRSRQVQALAAAPSPKVEHVAMQALEPEQAKTPGLVSLLETTRQVFSHPAEGTWWQPAVLEYIQKHRQILLASIEARNARYVVFPGGGH